MEYRVLGSLEVRSAAHELRIAGLRSQRVLAMLLMNANRVVSLDRLADAVWEEDPPSTTRRQIQNRVASLRATLAPRGARLLTHATGYSLIVGPDELDADLFERLVSSAEVCGEPTQRAVILRQALTLWRGPVLDGLDSPAMTPAADLLEERRLQALSDYLGLQIHAGHYEDVIPELTRLKAEHPLRERFLSHWMQAVSAVGRRAEALDAYHEFRSSNIEQRGLDPGQELQRTYLGLLHQESIQGTALAGSRGLTPIPPIAMVVPRQLPRRPASLVARDRELATLSASLADSSRLPVIIIHGVGGVGKTTLALHAAHALADRFPDGQLYADLHGFAVGHHALPAGDVLGRFLRAIGIRSDQIPSDLDELSSLFRSVIADRRMLLVLDNAREHDQVVPLLPGTAGCAVVITSRKSLRMISGAHHIRLRPFSAQNAVCQLAHEIGEERLAAEPGAAADIARLCGGMPLALKIASSRLEPRIPLHSLASALADASHRLDNLELPEAGVRASISASHYVLRDSPDPLDELAERAFLLLTLLDGPDVSQPVAKALLREPGVMIDRAFGRLAEASLIDVLESGRYSIHELVRLYGREQRIMTRPTSASALTRALGVYVATAWNAAALIRPGDYRLRRACHWWSDSALRFPDSAAALDWSEAERENIMAAIRQSGSDPDIPAVIPVQLASANFGFFRVRGYWTDAIAAAQVGIAVARRAGDRRAEALLLSDAGRALAAGHNLPEAAAHIDRAMTLQRNIGDREGLAQSLSNMGVVHFMASRLDEALRCYRESLFIHVELRSLRGRAMTLDNLGSIYRMRGLYVKACDCHERALSIFRQLHDSYGQAVALQCLGELYLETCRYDEAVPFLEKCLNIYRHMGDRSGEVESLAQLGSAVAAIKCQHRPTSVTT